MFAAAPGGRADLHPGVLLPHRPELGQPRLLSQGRPLARRRGGARQLHRPVLRRQAGAAAHPAVARRARTASCWPRRCRIKAERKVEIRVPQRGTKTGIVEHALQQRARGARPQAGRKLLAAPPARGPGRALRAADGAAPHRGVRQQPHPGHQRGRRHDRRRAARASSKSQYRKFNIKSEDLTPGDDYAMMREVLTRRFKRLVLDEAEAPRQGRPASRTVARFSQEQTEAPTARASSAAAAADRPARRQCARVRRAARDATATAGRAEPRRRRRDVGADDAATSFPTGPTSC